MNRTVASLCLAATAVIALAADSGTPQSAPRAPGWKVLFDGTSLDAWRGYKSETVLNDFKLLEYELGSPDWETRKKASKFGEWPNYGRARKGHIAMQGDHTGVLAFRNIRIRELQ
jgi:hypothetical protein